MLWPPESVQVFRTVYPTSDGMTLAEHLDPLFGSLFACGFVCAVPLLPLTSSGNLWLKLLPPARSEKQILSEPKVSNEDDIKSVPAFVSLCCAPTIP